MRVLIAVTLILILVGLGIVLAENFIGEREFLNVNLFPDQISPLPTPETIQSPLPEISISPEWAVFKSIDHSFHFRYPPNWKIIETSSSPAGKAVYGMPVQSWYLVNYNIDDSEETFPDNAIRLEFEILTEGRKESRDNLIDCDVVGALECKELVINGIIYKRVVTKSRTGIENIEVATVKNDLIYRISGMFNSDKNQQGISQIEQVMQTFEIIQSS